MKNKSRFLETALRAAKRAEKVILDYYKKKIEVETKEDLSPVSVADKKAEEVIIETIKKEFPEHGFLGEESGGDILNKGYVWIIDPIDGTKNYLRRISLFGTQIALMKDKELILGVSNAPLLKELMYAEKGKGAYCNGQNVKVSSIEQLKDAYVMFGGICHFDKGSSISNLLSLAQKTWGQRGVGDFWSYHLLAQGKIDMMIEAQAKIWDIGAVKLIVEEAGGLVTNLEGESITGLSTSVLASNGKIHDSGLGFFKEIDLADI